MNFQIRLLYSMKKQVLLLLKGIVLYLLFASFSLNTPLSDTAVSVEDNVVYLLDFDKTFTSSTGSDGVKIAYPHNWNSSIGSDGRKIAYPHGWNTSTGTDGRKIAFPYSWTTSIGKDGRKIAYPHNWSTSAGFDGRKICYPQGWITSVGSDGRKVAHPANWVTTAGSDGRLIAYPTTWDTETRNDGRRFAFPYGWPIDKSGFRKSTKILDFNSHGIAIVFPQVENSEKIKQLINENKTEEAIYYALYLLINEND